MAQSNFAVLFDIRHGRIHRMEYYGFIMLSKLFWDGIEYLLPDNNDQITLIILLPLFLISFYLSALMMARRLRDVNLSGWWALPLMLMPVFLFVYMHVFKINEANEEETIRFSLVVYTLLLPYLFLLLMPPNKRDNKYGPYLEYGAVLRNLSTKSNK